MKYINKFLERKFILLFVANTLILATPLKTFAQTQINPDGTLSTNVNNVGKGVYEITGGARPNNNINLFHSLKDFSIQSGNTARFAHEQGVQNIITRITGGLPSLINGTIQTLINGTTNIGNANLFIINPSGIILGANIKLNIGGSFIGSTADSIKFVDGTEFRAKNPTANPLLTISTPLGLQFDSNPKTAKTASVIHVRGRKVTIQDSSLIATDDLGNGTGGKLSVSASELLTIKGLADVAPGATGEGNKITIESKTWQVNYGGKISNSLFAHAIQKNPNGDNIVLNINQLTIQDGATISVSNFQSQSIVPPVQGAVANAVVEKSDISANTQQGLEGRVIINDNSGLGTEFHPQLIPGSDITASSELGAEFHGTVEIHRADAEPVNGLVILPEKVSDSSRQIVAGCGATRENSFVVSGRGGLPANPAQVLRGQTAWQDVRDLSSVVSKTTATSTNNQLTSNQQKIVEAQGLIISADGTVQLVAAMTQRTPQTSSWQKTPQCAAQI